MFECLNVKMIKEMSKQEDSYISKKLDKSGGFSLIEMLVALAIFSVVILTATQIFVSGLGGTKRIFGQQAVQESGRFILEAMSKEIRMSRVDGLGSSAYASLPEGTSGPYTSLNITNPDGQAINYTFDNDNKQMGRSCSIQSPSGVELTGNFYLTKRGVLQPRITIVINLENKTDLLKNKTSINLQTTASSREYAP